MVLLLFAVVLMFELLKMVSVDLLLVIVLLFGFLVIYIGVPATRFVLCVVLL